MLKYYDNIEDFPLYRWRKCNKGEIEFTRIDVTDGTKADDKKHWLLIRQSHLDEFGLTNDFNHLLNLAEELAILQCDMVINDDRFLLNKIKRIEEELKRLINREAGSDLDTVLIHLSKWMNQMLNDKTLTVKLFYKMLKEYGKANQKN